MNQIDSIIQGWQKYDDVELPRAREIPVWGGNVPFPAPANRKLKAVWSMEAQQDLRVFHNLDAESKLVDILAKELLQEIDRGFLKQVRPDNHGFSDSL